MPVRKPLPGKTDSSRLSSNARRPHDPRDCNDRCPYPDRHARVCAGRCAHWRVSMAYVARSSKAGKSALAEIEKFVKQKESEAAVKSAELEKQQLALQKRSIGLSARAIGDLQKTFDKSRVEFERFQQDTRCEIERMQIDLRRGIPRQARARDRCSVEGERPALRLRPRAGRHRMVESDRRYFGGCCEAAGCRSEAEIDFPAATGQSRGYRCLCEPDRLQHREVLRIH